MKKLISIGICVVMMTCLFSSAISANNDEISVYINNERLDFDVPPIIIDDRTLVPMRAIFEALGAEVEWNEYEQSITATRGDTTTIYMQIGSYEVCVITSLCVIWAPWMSHYGIFYTGHLYRLPNEYIEYIWQYEDNYRFSISLNVAPQIIDNRTMIPIRVVAETLFYNVRWDEYERAIFIFDSPRGTGTKENPIIIETQDHLRLFDGNRFGGSHILLANDIIMPHNFMIDRVFRGVFDGGGHTITVDIHLPGHLFSVGLFYSIGEGGVVRNLNIAGNIIHSQGHVGGVTGWNRGTIENVIVTANITGDWAATGGIVGNNGGIVRNSYFYGTITGTGSVGDIVGFNTYDGIIENE